MTPICAAQTSPFPGDDDDNLVLRAVLLGHAQAQEP